MTNFKMDDDVIDFIEDKLNDLIDEATTKFNKPVAAELATSAAGLAAHFAKAGGTSKAEFIHLMGTIFDEMESAIDISQLN